MALVFAAAAAFISGMQVIHSYKHLVKHEVTKMRDILARAQKYIQIEDATWNSTIAPPGEKAKWRNRRRSLVLRRRLRVGQSELSKSPLENSPRSIGMKSTSLCSKSLWTRCTALSWARRSSDTRGRLT